MIPGQQFPQFNRRAVQPVECLKQGWDLIKDQYWLFVGMTVVALLIGGAVPLGILQGPMMCGLFYALLKRQAGEPIEFATLFKGFDVFIDGMIAGILHAIPLTAIIICYYIYMFAGQVAMMVAGNNGEPNPAVAVGFVLGIFVGLPIMFILLIVINIVFVFAHPLIVDRKLSGLDAVKHSFRAGMANFWSLFGLYLLSGLMMFGGALCCGIGFYFVMPIVFAAQAIAYRQVFGAAPRSVLNTPPLPPSFN